VSLGPVFVFDGGDLAVFSDLRSAEGHTEVYDIDSCGSTVGMDPELADGPESAAAGTNRPSEAAALAETLTRPMPTRHFDQRSCRERKALPF